MDDEDKNLGGRPTTYTTELRDKICAELADGKSLRAICRDEEMPHRTTVARWVYENKGEEVNEEGIVIVEGFYGHYTRAREIGLDVMADEIIEIADDGQNDTYKDANGVMKIDHENIHRSKLRCDKRQWYLSKMAPKRYGRETVVKHQQLDKEGAATDPVAPVMNIYAHEIAQSVHEEMAKVLANNAKPA